MDLDLRGKRALVTGGTRGIGRATAERLAQEGADVAFCARTSVAVEETAAALRRHGVRVAGSALDVRDRTAFTTWFAGAVAEFGGLDIVVSNVTTRPEKTGEDGWQEAFESDFLQHVRVLNLATPAIAAGGSIVFVSSIASVLTQLPPGEEAYGAMKAALINYTGQHAARLGPKGVRVNAVSPGPVTFEGGFWDKVRLANPQLFARAASLPALGRHGAPEEVADAIVFLASPRAAYITGANLRIDGGAIKAANF
jgi:3-oxoacyl-[acyl-carrier protein] reductase